MKVNAEPQPSPEPIRLPSVDGDVDWNAVAEDYHAFILSPFASEMVSPSAAGRIRNSLVADIGSGGLGTLHDMEVADFGCGPGNLIPHLPRSIKCLTGIDTSERALALAALAAEQRNLPFEGRLADLRDLNLQKKLEVIFSINAILPSTRDDVLAILATIRRHLCNHGRLVSILPAYDATMYVRELWRDRYRQQLGAAAAAQKIHEYEVSRQVDDRSCSYADDGGTSQCYHTPTSMRREFAEVGLAIQRCEKIYYPWDLAQKFGYGYFPAAPEEVWDWYVVAVPA